MAERNQLYYGDNLTTLRFLYQPTEFRAKKQRLHTCNQKGL